MVEPQIVHIVDDDEAVRESLAILLEAAGYATRTYASGDEFIANLPETADGCLLIDVRMPGRGGLEVQEELRNRRLGLPVIVMTGHADVPLAVRAMKAGAADFVEKPFEEAAILDSIRRAVEMGAARRRSDAQSQDIQQRLQSLTPRERQVLEALVAGNPNKVIAYELSISPRTVEIHRARVMEKMQAHSLSELVRMALRAGIGGNG